VRELLRVAAWRRRTLNGRHVAPSEVGFWPLAARLRVSRPPKSSNGSFVAIILVHRRPANVDLQIRAALHAPSVGEVIVSCNNPEVRLGDWVSVASPRLQLREETGQNQTRRYSLARGSGAERFVLPDDDVLMLPDALDGFCSSLPDDATAPIGLAGQRLGHADLWESAIQGTGEEVDVLNRAYACTRAHVEGVFRNAELLGWSEEETFSNPADDVLVSFAGTTCPTVVSFEHVNCITHSHRAISTYRQNDFHALRTDWVTDLRKALDRAPARRDLGLGGALPPRTSSVGRALNVAARPLRRRFYMGKNMRALSVPPALIRRAAGLTDYGALWNRRVQIGTAPAPLEGFIRVDDHASTPDLTACMPLWNPDFGRGTFAMEVVSFGALDRLPPDLVPVALAAWRGIMRTGARLIVGVQDSTDVLAARDAKLGVRSWASQLPNATEPMTSPLQLIEAKLEATLWDEPRLRDALEAQGFDVVASICDGSEIEAHPAVSPWVVDATKSDDPLAPVPPVLDSAAGIVVIARAR
jgi:hypothetical protein